MEVRTIVIPSLAGLSHPVIFGTGDGHWFAVPHFPSTHSLTVVTT